MGREIIIKGVAIKGKDKIEFFDNYTCGRDGATSFVQQYYNNNWTAPKGYTEEQIDSFNEFERADYFSIHFNLTDDKDYNALHQFMEQVCEYADKDEKEIEKAYEELESLKEAKKNCKSYSSYQKFNEAIENVEQWIEDEDYSRAKNILEGCQQVKYKFDNLRTQTNAIFKYFDRFELWLEASE